MVEKIKIAILGAGGFLGTKLTEVLSKHYNVTGFYHAKEPKIDITKKKDVEQVLSTLLPDIVIHSAGITNVDLCETDKALAQKVNVETTDTIIDVCNAIHATLIYISTDFVFDGAIGNYNENDHANPLSTYGLTKLESEKKIIMNCKKYIIIRVAILYGYNGNNSERSFVKWMHDSLKEGRKIKIVTDQVGTPTLIDDVACAAVALINKNAKGIYHVAGSQTLSRYEMATLLCDEFKFNRNLISPISSNTLRLPAKRPLNSSLSTEKLKKLGIKMHTYKEGLQIMKRKMEERV